MTWLQGPRPAVLATGLPLAAYIATASPSGYWLDGGTFVAQAVDMGIAHPPGHPLAGIVNALAMLLPIGPISYRVALVGSLCMAVGLLFFFRATRTTLRALGLGHELAVPLAIGATWWLGGAYGVWFQAVRPEVYALQAALVAFILERVVRFEAEWPPAKSKLLIAASFGFGLAAANHHLLALLLLPACAATLGRWVQERGWRPFLMSMAAGSAGIATYIYLPLRALGQPMLRLGNPSTPSSFYWTVSAQAFQKNQGSGVPQPLGERFADVVIQLAESLHPATLIVALVGMYVLIRLKKTRRLGVFWALILIVFLSGRAWLGFVRGNPDALGYLIPAMMAIVLFCAVTVGTFMQLVVGKRKRPQRALVWATAILTVACAWQFVRNAERASLARFQEADLFDDLLRRDLPARAVLLAFSPQTVFRFWGGSAEERIRPDITLVPVPLVPYPGMVDGLVSEAPELRDTLRGLLIDGHLRIADLQSLAAERPVLIELDPRVDPSLYEALVPYGAYYQVLAANASANDRREGATSQQLIWHALLERTGNTTDPETRAQILWRRFNDAVFYASLGDRDFARDAIDAALQINDQDESILALAMALQTPNSEGELEGPIDVRPFVIAPEPLGE